VRFESRAERVACRSARTSRTTSTSVDRQVCLPVGGDIADPEAGLRRTNIGAMTDVMRRRAAGYLVAPTRGGHTLSALALGARDSPWAVPSSPCPSIEDCWSDGVA
jgi:hypothetical protein